MGASAFTTFGSQTYNMPSYVSVFYAACIGGGGSGEDYVNPNDDDGIYGGGGGGAAAGTLSGNSATVVVGRGGRRDGNGINGDDSSVSSGASSIIARGGQAGGASSNTAQGGTSTGGGGSGQDGEDFQSSIFLASGRGGGAGLIGSGNAGRGPAADLTEAVFSGPFGGSGGDGATLPDGSGGGGGANAGTGRAGGDGGSYGGGGGAVAISSPTTVRGGLGANGAAYISWVDISAPLSTLSSGQSTTVTWSSPVSGGDQTATVSWTNTGTTNVTQTYTATDSRGAQSILSFTILPELKIDSFNANPNPQTSQTGTPSYTTTLDWNISGGTGSYTYSISPGGYSGSTTGSGSIVVNNLPQSIAGSNSPASITYTFTITDGYTSDTATITVNVYNDNNPDTITIPSTTTSGRALNNLEPNTNYIVNLGVIPGIDMPTLVDNIPGEVVLFSQDASTWSFNLTLNPANNLYVRFNSLPFNTDPTPGGVNPSGLDVGQVNTKLITAIIGTDTISFNAITRAPVIEELYDFEGANNVVPSPDIDTLALPNAEPYIQTGIDVLPDDIEIPVEIKVSDPNAQVQINGGAWLDMRQI